MDIILRGAVVYLFLLPILRALGRRSIGEMSPLELIVLVTMGDLVQQGITQEGYSLTGAFLAVATMGFWSVVFSVISYRSAAASRVLEGTSIVVIRDGHPLEDVMKRRRMSSATKSAQEHASTGSPTFRRSKCQSSSRGVTSHSSRSAREATAARR